ncbi:MAG TPA: response regulator [Chthoniobacterales bacterium]
MSESNVRGILLVEPYAALGIALSSALRKFAPHHAIRVTPTLADAEAATETIRPELFVLDLDPAPGGEVEFLNRLREHHPQSRVLVVAASPSRELRSVRGTSGGLQFIAKPFDLADFGATLQALLGPWEKAPTTNPRGTLRYLHPIDVVQLKCLTRATTRLRVESADGRTGEIYIRDGEVVHAGTEESDGLEALAEIFEWPRGKVSESDTRKDVPKTIDQPWQILLREMATKIPEDSVDSLGTEAEAALPTGKRILVIDDTEMLLIFAADVLRTADRSLEVITVATGSEGLELAATKSPDLILLDYSLTDMTGGEVCRRLLENEATARIPILMMSGHLPELNTVAGMFGNVVTTLPKPFLSGALINEVEKILAAGPLPEAPPVPPPSGPTEAPSSQTEAPSASAAPTILPNGHTSGTNGGIHSMPPPAPTDTITVAPPEARFRPPSQPPVDLPTTVAAEHREVTASFACEVMSVQLAQDFRMGALQLKPAEDGAVVRMNRADGSPALVPGRNFRLVEAVLAGDGRIDTLRLIASAGAEHPFTNGGDFAVDRMSAETAGSGQLMQLTGTRDAAMRVKLVAEFELVRVEIADTFMVSAIVLQALGPGVRVQTGENTAVAMQFYIHDVQLDDAGGLASLIVGSRR